tara:strand:+ start:165 stop:368 length:204 start_codon:yes stop_codon:yes gene_type:complete
MSKSINSKKNLIEFQFNTIGISHGKTNGLIHVDNIVNDVSIPPKIPKIESNYLRKYVKLVSCPEMDV